MPKIRIRGYKLNNGHKKYSRGIKLRKKRGHTHEMYDIKNTKGIVMSRCKICKFHFFYLVNSITRRYAKSDSIAVTELFNVILNSTSVTAPLVLCIADTIG